MFGSVSNAQLEIINAYFKQFVELVQYRKNKFEYVESTGNAKVDRMFNEWNQLIQSTEDQIKVDMKVLGETVLNLDKVEQGTYNCRIKSNTTNPMIHTLKGTINQMLNSVENDMTDLKNVVNSYAHDDFTSQVNVNPKLKDTMLEVVTSVNSLGNSLASSAKSNFENGQSLENNASIMKNSMHNLAAKANEQAASLEETSAAVEEITSITRNNAQNATKMATLGQTVKSAVTNGQDLASKTAESMEEINTKVSSINEAITVIDQIAFQTNILSLNAAVEAATAGEAGKGFAVVAQEVRNLASRSAEAAKEIKDLVEDANTKANEGKNISDEMIKGYETLNTHISETIGIIEDVSSSSREQMTGIEQINDAITMLDRVTQENASEANQTTNISNEVSEMANQLVTDAQNKKF
ncbi:methyl-accepting chemotaxis protein [Poseidonibacter lekithochrous]|uniref:methyl-accepting chemotaxis protein n=1 Tax=Poseidonibacter lekithochrous TaxID=1904463 RepID=UPI0009FB21B3|nr:methyl-accepting chemotaxis protein [Poseidonibacter lekithochrous]QKJ23967.1 MCP-domain signal transduction protein [Poseidonibacter lekithochrous]